MNFQSPSRLPTYVKQSWISIDLPEFATECLLCEYKRKIKRKSPWLCKINVISSSTSYQILLCSDISWTFEHTHLVRERTIYVCKMKKQFTCNMWLFIFFLVPFLNLVDFYHIWTTTLSVTSSSSNCLFSVEKNSTLKIIYKLRRNRKLCKNRPNLAH